MCIKHLAHSRCLVTEDITSSFDEHLLSTYCVPGPVVGAGDTERQEFDKGDR